MAKITESLILIAAIALGALWLATPSAQADEPKHSPIRARRICLPRHARRMAGRPHRPMPARKALSCRRNLQVNRQPTREQPMPPIDTVLQELQHRDHQRSRLLRAIENKAASESQTSLSVANYFQTQIEPAQRAHQFRSKHHPNKSPQGSRPGGTYNKGVFMTDTQNRDELVRLAGEQALLSRELRNLNADQQRDLLALRNLPTDMVLKTDWHAKGTTLLDRLRDRQQQMAIGHQRLAELAKLTGIT